MTITFIRELNMNLQETDGKKNFMCQWYKAYCVIQLIEIIFMVLRF